MPRSFDPADASACCALIAAAIETMDGLNDAARAAIRDKNTPSALANDLAAGYAIVEVRDESIVGVGCLLGDEIHRVYIAPSAQRSGVGTAIVRTLESHALARGLTHVRVDASPSSEPFYVRLGYVREGERQLERGDAVFRFVRMTKALE